MDANGTDSVAKFHTCFADCGLAKRIKPSFGSKDQSCEGQEAREQNMAWRTSKGMREGSKKGTVQGGDEGGSAGGGSFDRSYGSYDWGHGHSSHHGGVAGGVGNWGQNDEETRRHPKAESGQPLATVGHVVDKDERGSTRADGGSSSPVGTGTEGENRSTTLVESGECCE